MEKALSIPTILGILLGIVALFASVLAFGGNIDSPTRTVGIYLLVGSILALLGCVYWHLRLESREDIYPDILSTLVPENEISEVGAAHIAVRFEQCHAEFWIIVLAQNLVDAPSLLVLKLKEESGTEILPNPVPRLEMVLPPAAVASARIMMTIDKAGELKFKPLGACTSRERGKRVRFARRYVLQTKTSGLFQIAGILGGNFFLLGGEDRSIRVIVSNPLTVEGVRDVGQHTWQHDILWVPEVADSF